MTQKKRTRKNLLCKRKFKTPFYQTCCLISRYCNFHILAKFSKNFLGLSIDKPQKLFEKFIPKSKNFATRFIKQHVYFIGVFDYFVFCTIIQLWLKENFIEKYTKKAKAKKSQKYWRQFSFPYFSYSCSAFQGCSCITPKNSQGLKNFLKGNSTKQQKYTTEPAKFFCIKYMEKKNEQQFLLAKFQTT